MLNRITERRVNCMNIELDGQSIKTNGMSLLSCIKKLNLDSESLKAKPLAAMLGGEILNLGFVPKHDDSFILLRFNDEEGRRIYERTLRFIFTLAIKRLMPKAKIIIKYSIGQGVLMSVDNDGNELNDAEISLVKAEMDYIINSGFEFCRSRRSIKEATQQFLHDGQIDKVKLLRWRNFSYFDYYTCPKYSDYADYYYGEMAPNSSYVKLYDVCKTNNGVILLLPDLSNPDEVSEYVETPKLISVFEQTDRWGTLMSCANAIQLNEQVESGSIRELVRVNEALHEKVFSNAAESIIAAKAKAVLIAGPSSSGKTTSANRIATQLRASGYDPIMISLDDYYIDRDKLSRNEDGEIDLESIDAIDTERFSIDLSNLLAGKEVTLPHFNFLTGKSEETTNKLCLKENQSLIIEGLHALNPALLNGIDSSRCFKIYVSALTTLNLDDHNRIRTADLRLLRRLVRDYMCRGASVEHTLGMWQSVRRGETKWIFPYQENADLIINTTLHYEASVLKKYAYTLLRSYIFDNPTAKSSADFILARSILKYLNYFQVAEIEDEIPPTSIIREFIGGNTFYR